MELTYNETIQELVTKNGKMNIIKKKITLIDQEKRKLEVQWKKITEQEMRILKLETENGKQVDMKNQNTENRLPQVETELREIKDMSKETYSEILKKKNKSKMIKYTNYLLHEFVKPSDLSGDFKSFTTKRDGVVNNCVNKNEREIIKEEANKKLDNKYDIQTPKNILSQLKSSIRRANSGGGTETMHHKPKPSH
ncbi:hypothetical protein WA026_008005 [Henosepilachna vigintioctopunctata]|uniref:Uncharacterized protein n=1 Tax=Henosepilachna vigintioctopunctata TaxID=420089 RepID=A0AAW1TQU3_9CUCU